MLTTLDVVLLLLTASVVVVTAFRAMGLHPVLGYLAVGAVIGPHAANLMGDAAGARHLAEFGVVFLMFSIGLEFSLPRLYAMKRIVFGLGAAQVLGTMVLATGMVMLGGLSWRGGLVLGGTLAMSSTALLSKLLADRLELDSAHGREVFGVLLFQDLAVVPLIILIPALSMPVEELAETLALAAVKAAAVLTAVLVFGPRLMRKWFYVVARRRSAELFMLNVLLITLGLAWLTELAGLSLALGAFLAGMLISETEYRYHVEEDIKPFRDVLLGLFFVTVGMFLDVPAILANLGWVLLTLSVLLVGKFAVAGGMSRAFGSSPGTAIRTGLWLCAGGEFGFVLVSLIGQSGLVPKAVLQVVVAALVLSMLLAPFVVQFSDRIALRFTASEWLLRSMQLTRIAAQSMATDKHVIICGYGPTGQYLARFLDRESVSYVALDLDPERVREAAAAGDTVVFGDAARRETLTAAGIQRASALVISFANEEAALRVIHHVRALRPELPVIVRALDEGHMEKLFEGGATEVVPENVESAIMLASHALMLVGVPINRVVKGIREIRTQRYEMMRGFFHGATDAAEHPEAVQPRLHAVTLQAGAGAIGRCLSDLALEEFGVRVSAVRRRNIRGLEPGPETRFQQGDVVVMLGLPEGLSAAEERLLRG